MRYEVEQAEQNDKPISQLAKLVPIGKFCKTVGISRQTGYSLINEGAIKSVKIRSRRMVPIEEMERAIREGLK